MKEKSRIKLDSIKATKKALRNLQPMECIIIVGWGQVQRIGDGAKSFCVGPLPENDDSDIMTDYSAWTYGLRQSWIAEWIARDLKLS